MRYLFLLFLCLVNIFFGAEVLVTTPPQKYLVDRLTSSKITTKSLVPETASPHYYEPSISDLAELQKAKLWFRTGESFEPRLCSWIEKKVTIIDLRSSLNLLPLKGCCHEGVDPHIWMSVKLLAEQADVMAQHLIQTFPELKQEILHQKSLLTKECEELDQQFKTQLNPVKNIVVSHPAFGYLCRDYTMHQYSLEEEGKDLSLKSFENLLNLMKEQKIEQILVLPQYDQKAPKKICFHTPCKLIEVNPYKENVLENLQEIVQAISHERHCR